MEKTVVYICELFKAELEHVLSDPEFIDYKVLTFPSVCHSLQSKMEPINLKESGFKENIIIGSTCINTLKPLSSFNIIKNKSCFYHIAQESLVDYLQAHGSYIITPGWLKNWQGYIKQWGFTREQAGNYFNEMCRELVLLDTFISDRSQNDLSCFAEYLNIPFRSIPVGTDILKINLKLEAMELEKKKAENSSKVISADFQMSLDLIQKIASEVSEEKIIHNSLESIAMMFAPDTVVYVPVEENKPGIAYIWESFEIKQDHKQIYTERIKLILDDNRQIISDNNGVSFKVTKNKRILGLLIVGRLAHPEYLQRYIDLIENLLPVFTIVFTYSSIFKKVKEVEDALRNSLEEKHLLLKEINHRVKNSLNMVSSLLTLQAGQVDSDEVKGYLGVSRDRIISISTIHDMLFKGDSFIDVNLKVYIGNIAESLFSSFTLDHQGIELKTQLQEIEIDTNRAIPLGLIVNEILTNSFKYAFPDAGVGCVEIILELDNNLVRFVIRDNGIGIPKDLDWENSNSLGFSLIHSLTSQLDGNLTINTNNGTSFSFQFPFIQ